MLWHKNAENLTVKILKIIRELWQLCFFLSCEIDFAQKQEFK